MRAGKVARLAAWLAGRGEPSSRLADAIFYSDSINDLPLLEAVGTPVAVDPDPRLRDEALASRLAHRSPRLSDLQIRAARHSERSAAGEEQDPDRARGVARREPAVQVAAEQIAEHGAGHEHGGEGEAATAASSGRPPRTGPGAPTRCRR